MTLVHSSRVCEFLVTLANRRNFSFDWYFIPIRQTLKSPLMSHYGIPHSVYTGIVGMSDWALARCDIIDSKGVRVYFGGQQRYIG